jgi:hypothetical protein
MHLLSIFNINFYFIINTKKNPNTKNFFHAISNIA